MREFDKELQEKTDGRVSFKIYPGGVSGDEKDVVRHPLVQDIIKAYERRGSPQS